MDDEDYEPIFKRKVDTQDTNSRRSKRRRVRYEEDVDVDESDDSEEDASDVVEDEDSGEDNYENYFDDDTTLLRNTIKKHILSAFTKDQREALSKKVRVGVDNAFELCKELVEENMNSLFGKSPSENLWKLGMGPTEIKKYKAIIKDLRNSTANQKVTIKRVLDARISNMQKSELLGMFDALQTLEPYSPEYQELSDKINGIINESNNSLFTPEQMEQFAQKETELKKIIGSELPLKLRILSAEMDDKRKAAIYEKYLLLEKTPDDSTTSANLEEWIEEALKTPYCKMQPNLFNSTNSGETLVRLKRGFQEKLSEMDSVLEPLLSVFNNRMNSPSSNSLFIGLLGSPGVGKTAAGKVIAEVWGLPFHQISLGGILDASILDGQHQGWVGSNPGRFAKALQEMGVINGVIFLDEIDKLGETPHGLQVQYSLLHSTDPTQNKEVHDHYLGSKLPLDLSKCLIIAALNRTDGLDPALLNRMHIIKVPDYTSTQKTNIMLKHLFPAALANAGLMPADIVLPFETCSTIQNMVEMTMGSEGGVRSIKSCIRTIVDKLALLLHTSEEHRRELKLSFNINVNTRPIVITPDVVSELYKPDDKDTSLWHLYI